MYDFKNLLHDMFKNDYHTDLWIKGLLY